VYLVSSDAGFLRREIDQLTFNFSSLQFYELLLVVTAIVLARRRIWYDSVLLVGLENLLVLVPFILISQAALLDQNMVWRFCVFGGLAALFRFLGLKKFFKELNLPRRMLGGGLLLLLINIVLPLVYRHLHEFRSAPSPPKARPMNGPLRLAGPHAGHVRTHQSIAPPETNRKIFCLNAAGYPWGCSHSGLWRAGSPSLSELCL